MIEGLANLDWQFLGIGKKQNFWPMNGFCSGLNLGMGY